MNRETLKKLKSEAMELRRIAKKGLTREGNRKELFAKMKQMISKYDTDTPSASDQPEPTKKAPSKPKKHPNPNESFKNTTHANEKSDEQFRKETLKREKEWMMNVKEPPITKLIAELGKIDHTLRVILKETKEEYPEELDLNCHLYQHEIKTLKDILNKIGKIYDRLEAEREEEDE